MEKMDMDLFQFIKNRNIQIKTEKCSEDFLPMKTIYKIFSQIVKGVHALHQNWFFHRDIKPTNILINLKDLSVKLIDFSQTVRFSSDTKYFKKEVGISLYTMI